jgi:uncharacterized membrane protein
MTTLVAAVFPHQTTASAAAEDVQRLASDIILEPDAMAVVSRDEQGRFHVTTHHHAVTGNSTWGIFWLPLFSVLFFVPSFGMAVGDGISGLLDRIQRAGIDDAFQQAIRELLQPGASALFLAVDPTIPAEAVEALERFGGTVVTSPLPVESERDLQRALHGRYALPGS